MRLSKVKLISTTGFIFIGILVGIILTTQLEWTPKGLASKESAVTIDNSNSDANQSNFNLKNVGNSFTQVSKAILPTVVSISTSKTIKQSSQDDFFGPLLRDMFGRRYRQSEPQVRKQRGLGSGVIVSKDGYILTNNHVIEDADDIKVTLYDQRVFEAELVGTDPLTEIAVIKIDGSNLPAAALGNSKNLEVGEWVLAVGNPLELTSTVTAGIVSATGRTIGIIQDADREQSGGSYAIENFIQTDAAINRGNSGGALVNLNAEVIGINTAIATGTGYYAGYGFAVPIDLARKIMKDLINKGYVTRAWLGISMRQVDEAVAERFGLDRPQGVRIVQVLDDSPAAKSGLKVMDIILKLEGEEVNQSNEIQNRIALENPGNIVTLIVLRDGAEKTIRVKLGQRETGKESVEKEEEDDDLSNLGLELQNLTNDIRSSVDFYTDDEGILVMGVERYSAAYDAGIRRGQLILRVEDHPTHSVREFKKVLKKYKKGQVVIFYLKNRNIEFQAFVKLPN